MRRSIILRKASQADVLIFQAQSVFLVFLSEVNNPKACFFPHLRSGSLLGKTWRFYNGKLCLRVTVVVLGQIKVDEKSNEITAIPQLLSLLDIEGSIISIDATGTQTDIVELIVENKADYILAVKGNQHDLLDQIQGRFGRQSACSTDTVMEKGVVLKLEHAR